MHTYHPPSIDLLIWTSDAYNYNGCMIPKELILEKTSIDQFNLTESHQKNTCARHSSFGRHIFSLLRKTNALETHYTYIHE
jgi:hypothetical protein